MTVKQENNLFLCTRAIDKYKLKFKMKWLIRRARSLQNDSPQFLK